MSRLDEIADRTAAGIARAYRAGEATPPEVTECLLDRIEKSRSAKDNIFLAATAERARQEAERAAARYRAEAPLSALDGVPIAWKDLFGVAGARTTAGSRLWRDEAEKTADIPVVANAAASGLVTVGKVNLTEFAYSGLGLNPHFGTPINPNDRATPRSPGGSSSGSGAAVAARLVPVAVGSDTGGSVRIPAAFNGIVGYKTSTGRIDATGLVALARSYDTIGPLARSVEDCILVDLALRGAVHSPVRRRPVGTLTVVVPENVVFDAAEPAVVANFEASIEALRNAGATVRRERMAVFDEVLATNAKYGTLTAAEAYTEYRDLVDSDKVDAVDRRVVRRMLDGKKMSAADVLSIQRARQRLIPVFEAQLAGALLAMPTTPITAPEVAPLEADDEVFHRVNVLALRNTMLGNFLDTCGVAMPNGRDGKRLPTSLLLSAPHGEDERLLGHALDVERLLGALA